MEGLFSIKSDVFNFGILLLEILSGKKNIGFYQSDSINLIGYVSNRCWKNTCLYHIQNLHSGKINRSTLFAIDNMYYVNFRI